MEGIFSPPPRGKEPPKILIMEDDKDTKTLLSETLILDGFRVLEASDGVQGLKLLQENPVDLVLLDVMMPDLDGFEICKIIRADNRLKFLPILILTAKDEFTEKMKGFQAGSDDYITKPFILSEVLARINVHLRIQELRKNLAISEKRYRLLVENSPDGILSVSPDRKVLFHNSRFLEILHDRTNHPLVNESIESFFGLSDLFREINILMEKVVESKNIVSRETQFHSSQGFTVFLELLGIPVTDESSQVGSYQIIVRDITSRRRMDDALIQAEKINSLGVLTSGITHEINNPLTAISNAIQILQRKTFPPERKADLCDLVLESVGRIAKIVKDLSIFSKPTSGQPQLFSLKEAISETLSLVHYQIKDGRIQIECNFCEDSICIFGDRNHFQQVMVNLLVNSIQAIESAGRITISLKRAEGNAVLIVEDTGCGIPPDQLGQIFNPFFTTKRDWKATGLGLAVSYRIIQLFRGTINVHTTVGKGTRFTVTIPIAYPDRGK